MLLDARGLCLDLPDLAHRSLFGKPRTLRILDNVDIAIARGETVGIVGESGSGKTTLGRTLLRLNTPSAGSLHFCGNDITRLPHREMLPYRRRMQMIFQDPQSSLNPRHSIGTIIAGGMRLHGLDSTDRAVAAVLDRVGLPAAVVRRYPHQLSGGQRQRVGIARAIALRPEFVVADEIVSGLDVSTQAQVLALLNGLKQDIGMALAFISHDLSVVRHICDRVVIMRAGKIVESGAVADVFEAPKTGFTRTLIAAIPLPEPDRAWLDNN